MIDQDVLAVAKTLGVEVRMLYQYSNRQHTHYQKQVLRKKNGTERVVYVPCRTLKYIQRRILDAYLYTLPVSDYATAYVPGKKLSENAMPHVGQAQILKLDISGFFDAIDYEMMHAVLCKLGLGSAATALLANICVRNGVLPQGTPTSPYLANLVMCHFDEKVGAWCAKQGITYTRYCDDMTFSGDFDAAAVTAYVRRLLHRQGFSLNDQKTRCIRQAQQQTVTGIVVNEKPRVSAQKRRRLRQEVYYCQKYGIADCVQRMGTSLSEQEYLDSLRGRLAFALQVDPDDQQLQACLAAVQALARTEHLQTFASLAQQAESVPTLEALFSLWQLAHRAEGRASVRTTLPSADPLSFQKDGYISSDASEYDHAPRKVLFILKTADTRPEEEQLGELAYYLQHPELEKWERRDPTEEARRQAWQGSAVLFLNKRGGEDDNVLAAYTKKYASFIAREIALLAPDAIVLVGKMPFSLPLGRHTACMTTWQALLEDADDVDNDWDEETSTDTIWYDEE